MPTPPAFDEWEPGDLRALSDVASRLKRLGKPRHPQSLYDRIRRGALCGVQINGRCYIPRPDMERLEHEPRRRGGGRPRISDTRVPVQCAPTGGTLNSH